MDVLDDTYICYCGADGCALCETYDSDRRGDMPYDQDIRDMPACELEPDPSRVVYVEG